MEPMLPGASTRGNSGGVEVRQAIGISPRNQQQHLTAQSFGPRHPDCPRLTHETESESDQIARLFKETDTDKSGKLNMKEIKALCQKLGDTMSAKALEEAFERMDPEMTGEVDFEAFHAWRRLKIALYRKDLRRNVGNVFTMVDEDGGGTLDIEEVTQMMPKIKKLFKGVDFDPPFELERDFADMDKRGSGKEKGLVQTFAELDVAVSGVVTLSELRAAVVAKGNVSEDECEALFEICGAGKGKEITTTAFASGVKQWRRDNGEVSWDEFEEWFMKRTGDDEPSIPVLPEYMVSKVAEDKSLNLEKDLGRTAPPQYVMDKSQTEGRQNQNEAPPRTGRELWAFLRPRLGLLVKLQHQWGQIKDLYEAKREPMSEHQNIPSGIRDPDSTFSAVWDLLQILFLFYVTLLVPIRVGFGVNPAPGSGGFFVDAAVDLYFVCDLFLQFRTAVWTRAGVLEVEKAEIGKMYLRSWFLIDVLSCLPVTYVGLAITCSTGDCASEGGETKAFKILRLMRLAKLLRLARIKRLLQKYEDSVFDVTPFLGIIATLFSIVLGAHMVSCVWYAVGASNGQIACDDLNVTDKYDQTCVMTEEKGMQREMRGWVDRQEYAEHTSVGTKYMKSMYSIFTEEFAWTTSEQTVGVIGTLIIGLIYGSLAGVISSIMVTLGAGQQDSMLRMLSLKTWMKARGLKKSDKAKILAAFSNLTDGAAPFDEKQILADLPPSLSTDISFFLYGKFIVQMPIFKSLGRECLSYLCKHISTLNLSRGSTVYTAGQFGTEMYFIVSGWMEVTGPGHSRMGFLGEGAFFGETPLMECVGGIGGDGSCIRSRTVLAVRLRRAPPLGIHPIVTLEKAAAEYDRKPGIKWLSCTAK